MSGDLRLSLIDPTNIEDHYRLMPDDTCYFLHEYTPKEGFSNSDTNSRILNLKKKPSLRNTPQYRYKNIAISQCANFLRVTVSEQFLASSILVPVPPSKVIGHEEYDDRMERVCRGIGPQADVRTLVRQTVSTEAAHLSGEGHRPSVDDLVAIYEIDEAEASDVPNSIGIVDDVLTAGTHFKAMQWVLQRRFPEASLYGIFLARRVLPARDASAFFGMVDED